jgi:exo-1,4-beta-D-glucosaminidase
LNNLPKAKVSVTKLMRVTGSEHWITLSLANNGNCVAFMVHPRLTRGKGGDDVVPVFWSDNYFSLLPGEKKSVTVKFDSSSLAGKSPELIVDGWNLEPMTP